MSDTFVKEKHSTRIHKEQSAVKRQTKIAKEYGMDVKDPHRFAKRHAMNCGNPKCHMCGNPRKVWKEKTIQEKKFDEVPLDIMED